MNGFIQVTRSAIFSEDGKYRYVLSRDWSIVQKPVAMCIGLNPSTANSEEDDPTIRILIRTLNKLGFGGLRMLNLYALISSTPEKLFQVPDSIGVNDKWLETTAQGSDEIIFCWGDFKNIAYRVKKVRQIIPNNIPKCFGRTKNGSPLHPMAIMWQGIKEPKLIPYE